MTLYHKNRTLTVLTILFVLSFFLPVVYSPEDMLLGFHCAVWSFVKLFVDIGSGKFPAILVDIFHILPNILMLVLFVSRKKISLWLKYLFFIIVLLSSGSWIFIAKEYLSMDSITLNVGYWLWFLSSIAYILVDAFPARRE